MIKILYRDFNICQQQFLMKIKILLSASAKVAISSSIFSFVYWTN